MSDRIHDNAVMQRLERLRDQYRAFVEQPDARILRWRLASDEPRMIDALVVVENDHRLEQLPDLLVVLSSSFEHADTHGEVLRRELVAQYEQARAEVDEPELSLDWPAPPPSSETDGVTALVEAADSMARHHEDLLEHLTLVLQPGAISEGSAWCDWLCRLANALPPRVRVIVLDHEGESDLDALDELAPARVVTRRAALDMDGAYLELSEGRPDDRSPASEIRRGFVRMMMAGKHGDTEAAIGLGTPALRLAERQGWWDLAATLQLAMGGLLEADGQLDPARERYAHAEASAAHSHDRGDVAAGKLRMQAQMAEASVLLRQEQWRDAARTYQAAASQAEREGDVLAAHDGWRLASHAHDRDRRSDDAWRCGARALSVGEAMHPSERRGSTLPYTGRALLDLTDRHDPPADVDLTRGSLSERLDAVLGPDWRASV